MTLKEIQTRVQQLQGRKELLSAQREDLLGRIRVLNKRKVHAEQARVVVKAVALKTQDQLRYHVSEIVSLALEAVFPEPYTLDVEFVERRGRTECDIYFGRDGQRVDPLSASGGGAVDVASFALRVAVLMLQRPVVRPLLVLDEPFKHLSATLLPQAAQMLREVAERLGLQIIMVTHSPVLAEAGDKVFHVSMSNGVSRAKEEM